MNPLDIYREQQILTSSAPQLVLMQYNRTILELTKALKIENWADRAPHFRKTTDILLNLMNGCVMETELGPKFYQLYEFHIKHLTTAQIRKDDSMVQYTLNFLVEIRDAWEEAMKKAKTA